MTETFTRADSDNLADIIWWIKGYLAANASPCPFSNGHIESLRKARAILEEAIDDDD